MYVVLSFLNIILFFVLVYIKFVLSKLIVVFIVGNFILEFIISLVWIEVNYRLYFLFDFKYLNIVFRSLKLWW